MQERLLNFKELGIRELRNGDQIREMYVLPSGVIWSRRPTRILLMSAIYGEEEIRMLEHGDTHAGSPGFGGPSWGIRFSLWLELS